MKYLVVHDGDMTIASEKNLNNVVARMLNDFINKHGRLNTHNPQVFELGRELKYTVKSEVVFDSKSIQEARS